MHKHIHTYTHKHSHTHIPAIRTNADIHYTTVLIFVNIHKYI